jgi:hypothetical protein
MSGEAKHGTRATEYHVMQTQSAGGKRSEIPQPPP